MIPNYRLEAVQGTTPEFTFTMLGDITDKTIEIYISQSSDTIMLTNDRLGLSCADNKTTIAFQLTQEETLRLKPGKATVQIRYIDENENTEATKQNAAEIFILPLSAKHVIKF